MVENGLEPENYAVGLALAEKLCFKNPINFDDLIIGDSLQVESKQSRNLTHNQRRVDDADQRLMRDPLLHGSHGYSVDIVPELYLVVIEVLIMNDCTLIGEDVGEDESLPLGQVQIPGLDDAVQHPIEMHAVAHGLPNDDINFRVEIVPGQH